MSERHTHIARTLIETVAYGDAAGLPVETMSAAKIAARYGRIDRLLPPKDNPFYVGDFPAGTWSDDTHLTMVVADALSHGDFDLRDIADKHVVAYHETPQVTNPNGQRVTRGWGGSTTRSVQRIIDGIAPEKSGEQDGGGNGVVMKMSPLVLWQHGREVDDISRYEQYDQLTTMTHDSDIARAATRIHGDVLFGLLGGVCEREEFLGLLRRSSYLHDPSGRFWEIFQYMEQYPSLSQAILLRETDGKGFFVPYTLAMAYGVYLMHPRNIGGAVYEAVNLGGDTDSIASIAATMVRMTGDHETILPPDSGLLFDRERLQKCSERLAKISFLHR